jgi:hypothetical protein
MGVTELAPVLIYIAARRLPRKLAARLDLPLTGFGGLSAARGLVRP